MSEPTAIEKEAGKIVEGACASLEACPCGCNREATAGLFAEMPDEELLFDVADLFKAFSDTTRIKILFALMGGGLSVGDITAVVGCTQSAVSHQLRTLKHGLSRSSHSEQGLFMHPATKALDQLMDSSRLIACRLILGYQLKFFHTANLLQI